MWCDVMCCLDTRSKLLKHLAAFRSTAEERNIASQWWHRVLFSHPLGLLTLISEKSAHLYPESSPITNHLSACPVFSVPRPYYFLALKDEIGDVKNVRMYKSHHELISIFEDIRKLADDYSLICSYQK
jgi:hypothetical protein